MGTRMRISIVCMGLILFGTITYGEVDQESTALEEALANNIKEEQEYSQEDRTTKQMIQSDFTTSEERTTPAVISVDIPTHINMIIDPYETMRSGAIISEEMKVTNYSDVAVDINLVKFQVDIPEASEVVYTGLPIPENQSKSLGLYLWNEESRKRLNLYEGMGVTRLDTLAVGQVNTYIIKGGVNSTNAHWHKGDAVNAEFIFTINPSW